MQVVTTFTSVEMKTGNGQNGPWTLKVYKDSNNGKYQTFKPEIQQVADQLIGQPVSITFDVETRNYTDQNGVARTANNNILSSVEAASAGAAAQPLAQAAGTPAAFVPQPQAAPAAQGISSDVRNTQINRSAALARAIEAHAAGIAVVTDPAQLGLVANLFVKYIETGSF